MELAYKSRDGRLTVKLTGDSAKNIFKEIAGFQEIFEAESSCGVCGGIEIKYQLRRAGERDEFDYYELVCKNQECRAKFSFGQSKDQKTLFPKRKDEDGNWLPNRGWEKYIRPDSVAPPNQQHQTTKRERWPEV